jgi:hypothetical protein
VFGRVGPGGLVILRFPAKAGIQSRAEHRLTVRATPGLPPARENTHGFSAAVLLLKTAGVLNAPS